jgi:predicted DNA-binding transcriptional regulator AlpA
VETQIVSKVEIRPLRLTIEEFATLANCSTSQLWNLTNKKSPKFDPTAPLRIKLGGSTRFDTEQCVEWLKAPTLVQQNKQQVGSL